MGGSADHVDGLTVAFDKGRKSEDNIAAIDARGGVHFITSYSPQYCEELIHVDRSQFRTVDTVKNKDFAQKGREEDRLTACRTEGEFWGEKRTVLVTYNP